MLPEKKKELIKKISVLYVEDEEQVRKSFEIFLRRRFDRVYLAADGREALAIFEEKSPDLVITDLQMPVMDGISMLRQIRKLNSQVPVIVTTAFTEQSYLLESIELGVTKYLRKPIVIKDLDREVESVVEVIIQKQIIHEKETIIQSLLDSYPYHAILVEGSNIDHISRELLDFLGYSNPDEFLKEHQKIQIYCNSPLSKANETVSEVSLPELIKMLEQNSDYSICLRQQQPEGAHRFVRVRVRRFENSELFLVLFDLEQSDFHDLPHEACKSCHYFQHTFNVAEMK